MKFLALVALVLCTSCVTFVRPSSPNDIQAQFAETSSELGSVAFTLGISKTDFIPDGTVEMLVKNLLTGSTTTIRASFPTSPNSLPGKKFGHAPAAAMLPVGTYKVEKISFVIPAHKHLRMIFTELEITTGLHDQIPTFEIKPKALTHLFNLELTLQLAKTGDQSHEYYTSKFWIWYEHPGSRAWKDFSSIINSGSATYLKKDGAVLSFVPWGIDESKNIAPENVDNRGT